MFQSPHQIRPLVIALLGSLGFGLCLGGNAAAGELTDAIVKGTPNLDMRLRYENGFLSRIGARRNG